MFQNPVTKAKLEDLGEYTQSLIESYIDVKIALNYHGKNEGILVAALDEVASRDVGPAFKRGTINVLGTTKMAKIIRKTNAKYERAKGAEHPLRKLMQEFDSLVSKIRVDYKESGQAIQALIDRHAKENDLPDDDVALAEELVKVRTESAAKPSIKIEDRTDVPESTETAESETPTF